MVIPHNCDTPEFHSVLITFCVEFPWCGFLIDTRDLEVFSNYQQYLGGR